MISRDDVVKLAELARLKVTDAEVDSLQKDIGNILDYVGQVSSVEAPRRKEAGLNRNRLREDEPYAEDAMLLGKRDALLNAFPTREGDFNSVRKIIDKDEA